MEEVQITRPFTVPLVSINNFLAKYFPVIAITFPSQLVNHLQDPGKVDGRTNENEFLPCALDDGALWGCTQSVDAFRRRNHAHDCLRNNQHAHGIWLNNRWDACDYGAQNFGNFQKLLSKPKS